VRTKRTMRTKSVESPLSSGVKKHFWLRNFDADYKRLVAVSAEEIAKRS
jgi:hypothetical protein